MLLSITTACVHAARRLNQKQLRGLYNVSKREKTFETTRSLHCFKGLTTRENPQHEVLKLLLQQRKLVEIIITISFLNSNIDLSELWYVNLSPTCCLLVCDNYFICIQCHFVIELFVTSDQAHWLCNVDMEEYGLRPPKTSAKEEICAARAILKCTQYKNKWAVGIFEDWRPARFLNVATL